MFFMQTAVTADALWDGTSLHTDPLILIEEGRILTICSRESFQLPAGARELNFDGATLGPAFFDVHIHGAAGHDVMEASPEALDAIGAFLDYRYCPARCHPPRPRRPCKPDGQTVPAWPRAPARDPS
jgi:imidazolonepropionase-like amidohydrolase